MSNVEEAQRGRANASTIRQEVEKEMMEGLEGSGWRCVAVIRDPRNSACIRITCRDDSKLAQVRLAAERPKAAGSRILHN